MKLLKKDQVTEATCYLSALIFLSEKTGTAANTFLDFFDLRQNYHIITKKFMCMSCAVGLTLSDTHSHRIFSVVGQG